MMRTILNIASTVIMVLVFSIIIDSQLELKPAIISLILRNRVIKRMTALGQGMVRLGIANVGMAETTNNLRNAIGYACESIEDGGLVKVDLFSEVWKDKEVLG